MKIFTKVLFCLLALGFFATANADQTVSAENLGKHGVKVPRGPDGNKVLSLKKGVYHFYASNAAVKKLYVSNHDQPVSHRVQLPLTGLKNYTLDGNGSTFVFHGDSLGILLKDCDNVTLKNLTLDYARPMVSEAKVIAFKDGKTQIELDKKAFPYEVKNGRLVFIFDNCERVCSTAIAFNGKTQEIVEGTSDIVIGGAELDGNGAVWLKQDLRKNGVGVAVGDVLAMRSYDRPHPCICVYNADNVRFENVVIHTSLGMGLLAQRSKNLTFSGGGVFPREGACSSTAADATHFSNMRGLVKVENAKFVGMLDDAINVHSTCLKIVEKIDDKRLKLQYMHPQAIGFEVFGAGENLRFIKAKTLENGEKVRVRSVETLSPTQIVVTLENPVPADVVVGDAVENADYQPEVIFSGNYVAKNRARGALFTTPQKIICENNKFHNVAGSAILLAGDAAGWYESGACEDVVIRKNEFVNNLTSRFQFTNAIISIYPSVNDLDAQKQFYHRNILICDNVFKTFDVPLLFAISTDNLKFERNKIIYNTQYRAWNQEAFQLKHCGKNIKLQKLPKKKSK
ncbi:MAG: hypothetical protein K6B46_01265 [Opitutales bacterium]|nr:hypothetical protein [Opitutales bacterium]